MLSYSSLDFRLAYNSPRSIHVIRWEKRPRLKVRIRVSYYPTLLLTASRWESRLPGRASSGESAGLFRPLIACDAVAMTAATSCYSSVLLDSQLRASCLPFLASRRFKRSSESRPRTLAKLLCNWTLSTAQFLLVFLLRALALSLLQK